MAKKKSLKTNRKHQLKYSTLSGAAPIDRPVTATSVASVAAKSPAAETTERDFSYVGHDLRRILVLGGGLIFFLIILWYLFGHTGLGSAVYNLIKI